MLYPTPINPARVQSGFGRLAGTSGGIDDGRPPLVLLHGLTFDRTMWWPALEELATIDPDRRTLALDLPGHGASARHSSYGLEEVAALVKEAVDEAGLSAPVVVGHSVSGLIATTYGAHYPASGVVSVDQVLTVEPFATQLHAIEDLVRGDGFSRVWSGFYESMRSDQLPDEARELVAETCRPDQEVVVGYWEDVFRRSVTELRELVGVQVARLRRAEVPYLLVAGTDPGEAYREWLASVLPGARVVVLADTGHFPHLGQPRQFASCLAV
jgi:pimeloyl-ACP methyl ester carboxylesterase